MTECLAPGYAIATIYATVKAAALAGQPAPTNRALAELIGAKSRNTPLMLLAELVNSGRVVITRWGNGRVIECAHGEWKTAQRDTAKPMVAPPRSDGKRSRPPRAWSADEDAILRSVARGEQSLRRFCAEHGIPMETARYRMIKLGLTAPRQDRAASVAPEMPPQVRDGWIPIAHGNNGRWREYDGTPISVTAAKMAVAAGRATTAQRKIDGGYDLLFRVVRA